ncbi:Aste57867_9631 [Aphanomyces stellatus]|uniref:Aste57867_9631 protein n=1 Tax=Aphanomyces stellatus TaxID=120398 RepID=A0A485KNU8_9STRA|nr:hypothetical protein As57867_009593 [Aphanomyces stellatus]VFT86510.1 Aste57867_9631 [Aphanomyces stellatus]
MQIPWLSVFGFGLLAIMAVLHSDELLPSQTTLHDKYSSSAMDLQGLVVPVLTGAPLRLLARVSGLPVLGPLVMKMLKRDNYIARVRELAATLDDPPLYYPLHFPTTDERQRHAAQSNDLTYHRDTLAFKRYSIQDYIDAYTNGQVTPLQVAKAVVAAINASNTAEIPLRAVIASHTDEILRDAAASTARYAAGTPNGSLDGIPVLVKDETEVRGYETNSGTSFLGKLTGPAAHDAVPVARLRKAGALIVGKTNMHEWGTGVFGLNNAHGATRNAYSRHHMAGGSSSGSGAAVGAGLVPLALGCDGGGSIRIPSAFNGVVGIKATFMRVPVVVDADPSLAHIGPIAASVQDAALAYAIISGQDPSVPMSSIQPLPHVNMHAMNSMDLSHLRVGVFPEFVAGADPEILAQYYAHLKTLTSLGATLVNVTIPNLQTIHLAHAVTILSEMALSTDRLYEHFSSFSPEVQISIHTARLAMTSIDLLAAQIVRSYASRLIRDMFDTVDVFLTPATAITAPDLKPEYLTDGLSNLPLNFQIMRFIVLGNLVGFPSMTVPMGYDASGLPTSMLVQAAHWNEDVMLHVARVVEKHAPIQQPSAAGYFYDILKMAQLEDAN